MEQSGDIPSNVPRDRVVDFDIYDFTIRDGDYARTLKSLTARGLADLLWTPHKGGHWIVTRAAGIKTILSDHDHFSSATAGPVKPVMEQSQKRECPFSFKKWFGSKAHVNPNLAKAPLVPLQIDPPEHAKYRKMIADAFAPGVLAPILADTRAFAIELIESFKSRGECEFFHAFAHQVPVANFLKLVDLPTKDREFLVQVVGASMHGSKRGTERASRKLVEYGMRKVRERRAAPGSDLISSISAAQVDGKLLDDPTIAGMVRLILLAGFDTVASMLGFFAHFFAHNPTHRHELINKPELIPNAIEELLRRFANVMLSREVRQDFDYGGVTLRKGDMVAVPTALAGLDERKIEDPLKVDFTRFRPHHTAFGDGPHRCLGASVAREELRIFLEEWLKRIPNFEVKPDFEIRVVTNGPLATITSLPLRWKVG
jgi:cytochrome P450